MRQLALLIFFLLPATLVKSQELTVFVFVPSNVRPFAMQEILQRDLGNEIKIRVFGRYNGFQLQVNEMKPDAILSLSPVLKVNEDRYQTVLAGIKDGKQEEQMVLLADGRMITPVNLQGKSVGVINLLGRRNMLQLVSRRLQHPAQNFKLVAKLEDLLHMLQLQDVEAVLIPGSRVKYYQERSELNLKATPVTNFIISFPSLAVNTTDADKRRRLEQSIRKAGPRVLELLGVDGWSTPMN